jgi:hypothetical protein
MRIWPWPRFRPETVAEQEIDMTGQTDEYSIDAAPEVLRHGEKFLESLCDEGVRHGFIKR